MTTVSIPLVAPPVSVVPPPTPGWKTSEFWKGIAAMALTAVFASGAITNNTVLAVAGIAAAWLTSLGYTVGRTMLKRASVLLPVMIMGAVISQSACAEVRPRLAAGSKAFIDCENPALKATVDETYELAKDKLLSAIADDGTINDVNLKLALAKVKSNGLRCAFEAAIAALAKPEPGIAARSTGRLPASYAKVTAELGWPTYKVGP